MHHARVTAPKTTSDAGPCPCGSGSAFTSCCGPLLAGTPARTAGALMRSRYSAYVRGEIDYILATHDPAGAGDVDRAATEKWSREAEWLGLTIVATEQGGEQDDTGMVEFIARHKTEGVEVAHHERSQFRKLDGAWRFVSGTPVKQVPVTRGDKTGRNDPCPCGSGKKYKKCHGA